MIYQILSEVNIHKAIIKYNDEWHKIRNIATAFISCMSTSFANGRYFLR